MMAWRASPVHHGVDENGGGLLEECLADRPFTVILFTTRWIGVESSQGKLAFPRVYCGAGCVVTDVSPAMVGITWIPIVSFKNRMPEAFFASHLVC